MSGAIGRDNNTNRRRSILRPVDENNTTLSKLKNDYLICGLCKKEFIQPKCLNCSHRFCADCLHIYITGRKTLPKQQFRCPYNCGVLTTLPSNGVSGLKTDTFIEDVQNTFNSTRKPASRAQIPQSLYRYPPDSESNDQKPIPAVRRRTTGKGLHIEPLDELNTLIKDIEKELKFLTEQIGFADKKINACEEKNMEMNQTVSDILETIDVQEKLLIKTINKKAEELRQQAIDIISQESETLAKVSKSSQKARGKIIWYKNHGEQALESGDSSVMRETLKTLEALNEFDEIVEPLSSIRLTVYRTAQADAKPFNLLVQKTTHPVLTDHLPSDQSQPFANDTLRRIPKCIWYLAESDEEDPDHHSDRFLGQIQVNAEAKTFPKGVRFHSTKETASTQPLPPLPSNRRQSEPALH